MMAAAATSAAGKLSGGTNAQVALPDGHGYDVGSLSEPAVSVLARTRHNAVVGFILATALLDIVSMGIIIPVFPTLIEQFAGSNADAGWINGAFVALWAIMQFLASPVIGSLSDQWAAGLSSFCPAPASPWTTS
jgi:hypothetical protein